MRPWLMNPPEEGSESATDARLATITQLRKWGMYVMFCRIRLNGRFLTSFSSSARTMAPKVPTVRVRTDCPIVLTTTRRNRSPLTPVNRLTKLWRPTHCWFQMLPRPGL